MSEQSSRRRMLAAAVAAVGLLVSSGIGYRALAAYLARPTDSVPLPPGTLARLPLSIGQWTGRDVAVDEAVIRATDTDDRINRQYSRQGVAGDVGVYVAYGVRARDLMPHRPEVCYPGAGWTLQDVQLADLPLPDGSRLPCRVFRFSRGALDAHMVTVLNYYVVDGQYCPDVSLLRSRAWRGGGSIRYMAQVLITCSGNAISSPESTGELVNRFAVDSAGPIRALFPSPNPADSQTQADRQPFVTREGQK